MMAAAVIWPHEDDWTDKHREMAPKLKDSKKVTPKRRAVLETEIRAAAIAWGVGAVTSQEIDALGVSWANQQAFVRAVESLSSPPAEQPRFLVDGVLEMPAVAEYESAERILCVDGDATYMSIAAASILAKEAHDRWIRDYCEAFPEVDERYGLTSCKGYGTAKHRAGIAEHGLHALHRRRFVGGPRRRKAKDQSDSERQTLIADDTCLVQLDGSVVTA
jgi:ribonuclease HII